MLIYNLLPLAIDLHLRVVAESDLESPFVPESGFPAVSALFYYRRWNLFRRFHGTNLTGKGRRPPSGEICFVIY